MSAPEETTIGHVKVANSTGALLQEFLDRASKAQEIYQLLVGVALAEHGVLGDISVRGIQRAGNHWVVSYNKVVESKE